MGRGWYVEEDGAAHDTSGVEIFQLFEHMVEAMNNTSVREFIETHMEGLKLDEVVDGVMRILVATDLMDADRATETLAVGQPADIEVKIDADQFVTLFVGGIWAGYAHAKISDE